MSKKEKIIMAIMRIIFAIIVIVEGYLFFTFNQNFKKNNQISINETGQIKYCGASRVIYEINQDVIVDIKDIDTTTVCAISDSYEYTNIEIDNQNNFKSYMPYTAITNTESPQYKLQELAKTGNYGIRTVNGRYCIAVGTGLNAEIGTYLDLILETGVTIPCIVGDIKADIHTLSDNITTASNGCVSEFIVDDVVFDDTMKTFGNVSKGNELWDSPVVGFNVYDVNILKEQN